MNQEDLDKILKEHKKWLLGEGGKQADLRSADLRSADLRSADLRSADLRYADLRSADLRYADLRSANLRYANLRYANLRSADLRSADLRYADLRSAHLRSADLRYANLQSADLQSADLESADLDQKYLKSITQVCPQVGQFIAYKRAYLKSGEKVIVKLRVPEKSPRLTSFSSRKCRAKFVTTLEIFDTKGNRHKEAFTNHGVGASYKVGRRTTSDKWDNNPANECSHGIHFFITKKEAERY